MGPRRSDRYTAESASSFPIVLPAQQHRWRVSPLGTTLANRHFSRRKRATPSSGHPHTHSGALSPGCSAQVFANRTTSPRSGRRRWSSARRKASAADDRPPENLSTCGRCLCSSPLEGIPGNGRGRFTKAGAMVYTEATLVVRCGEAQRPWAGWSREGGAGTRHCRPFLPEVRRPRHPGPRSPR